MILDTCDAKGSITHAIVNHNSHITTYMSFRLTERSAYYEYPIFN